MSRIWKKCLFLVFLGGGEGGKIFWGLPNRFSTNPERIVKVRESAPSKIGLLCIALFTVPRADDDVVVDDRLMMACNIYIFQLFSKKLFWQCWETYQTMLGNISNNILFKNIAHDRSISKFYPNCICVFVYLCICICVFGYPRLLSDQLELFVTSPFSLTFSLGHSKWPKKCWKHFPIEQVLFYISPCNSCGHLFGSTVYMIFGIDRREWQQQKEEKMCFGSTL